MSQPAFLARLSPCFAPITGSARLIVADMATDLKAERLGLTRHDRVLLHSRASKRDLMAAAKTAGFEIVRDYGNHKWLLRPIIPSAADTSLSVIVPARNEKGNIEPIVKAFERWSRSPLELIFVESNSSDGTWEEIERVRGAYPKMNIKTATITERGKWPAVRKGFELATQDLLVIFDADITVPPETIPDFHAAWCEGQGDFINGSRLKLKMEKEAMRPLNWLGNHFFAQALRYTLRIPISDALCGTKLFARSDWQRMQEWCRRFGEYDPFGDFDMLFSASDLGLGVVDLPIRYGARTYGETNIHRFRHGLMLFKMLLIGWRRLR